MASRIYARWQMWPSLAALWLLLITLLAIVAAQSQTMSLIAIFRLYPEREHSFILALAMIGSCCVLSIVGRSLRRSWRGHVVFLPVSTFALWLVVASGSAVALATVVAVFSCIALIGSEVAARLLAPIGGWERWVVGSALGLGLLGAIGFLLASLGVLRPSFLWTVLLLGVGVTLVSRSARQRLRHDWIALREQFVQAVERGTRSGIETGLLLGVFLLALIGALAPETASDAIRIRLPTASILAQQGRLPSASDWAVLVRPGLGEIIYAVVLACGPLQGVKIANFLVGLCCVAGVLALARSLKPAGAALPAVQIFCLLPLALWLAQTAYNDLFVTLFAVAAVLIVVRREQITLAAWGIAATCIGMGLLTKASFTLIAAGLGIAFICAACNRYRSVLVAASALTGIVLLLCFGLWVFQAVPQVRAFPGGELAMRVVQMSGRANAAVNQALNLPPSPRTPLALFGSPFNLTFQSSRFGEYQDGFLGYLLIGLLPLVLLVRPSRPLLIALAGATNIYLIWFFYDPYLRYALPLFAISSAVGGAAYAAIREWSGPLLGGVIRLLLALLMVCSIFAYLNSVLVYPGVIPFDVTIGRQDKDAYLRQYVPAYNALRLLDAEQGATRAATAFQYAQLYTHVRLAEVFDSAQITDEQGLLEYLDRGGFSHIIVDRSSRPGPPEWPRWDRLTIFQEEFLRRNTLLVGGDHNAYLYRLVAPEDRGREQPWARGSELIPHGNFDDGPGDQPVGWSPIGSPHYDRAGQESGAVNGAIRVTPVDAYFSMVNVTPDRPYLLSHKTRSVADYGLARLQINWLDSSGALVGVSIEVVPTSPSGYYTYSMLATAPPTAVTAVIYAQAQQGQVWFDDVSLRSIMPDEVTIQGCQRDFCIVDSHSPGSRMATW